MQESGVNVEEGCRATAEKTATVVPLKREMDSTGDDVRVDLPVVEESENDACDDNLVVDWAVGK